MTNMNYKNTLSSIILLALLSITVADEKSVSSHIEVSTESPIAEMGLIDSEIKTSTEKPPIAKDDTIDTYKQMAPAKEKNESKKDEENREKPDTQTHTVGDFIIHPLIAFKPRSPVDENAVGKQVSTTTTPSPWTFFGINAGQGLGSLAGSLTGWLNDRIQLPGLVDTPVRESTTTSTTTTTLRPDVVVHVQHRGSTRRPLLSINNESGPNRFGNNNNLNYDTGDFEQDYDDDDIGFQGNNFSDDRRRNNRRRQNQFSQNNHFVDSDYNNYNEDYDNNNNDYDDADSDYDGYDLDDGNRENNPRRKKVNTDQVNEEEDDEVEEADNTPVDVNEDDPEHEQSVEESSHEDHNDDEIVDDDEEDENNEKPIKDRYSGRGHKNYSNRVRVSTVERPNKHKEVDSEENPNEFYYAVAPSTKRSQSQINFLQQRQQSLINQIRQLTGVPSPGQIDTIMQKAHPQKHRQQATLFVNRNGQTIYMAPEVLGTAANKIVKPLTTSQIQYYPQMVITKNSNTKRFPQPPLTKPLKRKGRPTQYITIPWSKLGIAPPDQVVALAEGIQSEPHILNIPQSAVNVMSNPIQKKKRPIIAADAVPLLAEASLIDIFQPPKIPPSRSVPATSTTISKIVKPAMASGTHLLVATNLKSNDTTATILPHRIRGGTIVEKAPAITSVDELNTSEENDFDLSEQSQHDINGKVRSAEKDFILVGQDEEPGLTRQVQPVYGDMRKINGDDKIFFKLQHRGNFALRKRGRALENSEQPSKIDSTNHSPTQRSEKVFNKDAMPNGSLNIKQQEYSTNETLTGSSSATKSPVANTLASLEPIAPASTTA